MGTVRHTWTYPRLSKYHPRDLEQLPELLGCYLSSTNYVPESSHLIFLPPPPTPRNVQRGLPKALGSRGPRFGSGKATPTLQPSLPVCLPTVTTKGHFLGGAFHRHMTAEGGQARTTSLLAHDDATAQRCTAFLEVPSPDRRAHV